MNQTFREEAAKALTVGGTPLEALHVACRSRLGVRKIYDQSLRILNLEERLIVSLLRDHMAVYALVEQGKVDTSGYVPAGSLVLAA